MPTHALACWHRQTPRGSGTFILLSSQAVRHPKTSPRSDSYVCQAQTLWPRTGAVPASSCSTTALCLGGWYGDKQKAIDFGSFSIQEKAPSARFSVPHQASRHCFRALLRNASVCILRVVVVVVTWPQPSTKLQLDDELQRGRLSLSTRKRLSPSALLPNPLRRTMPGF